MTAFVKQLSQQSLNNLSLTWQCTFFVTISRHQIRDLTFTFAHNWGLKNAVYDCCPKDRPPKRAAEKKGQNQVCSHIWWNDTFPRVLRLSEGAGCWQQELLSGMQVSAEHKSESLQPVHSKDKLSPHPTVAHLHGCSANKLPAIASTSVPGIPFLSLLLFCSSYTGILCMRRNSQNPKKISNWKENPCSVLDRFAGSKTGWAEGSAASGCILYKREGKASKPDWFPLQWLKNFLLTYTSN